MVHLPIPAKLKGSSRAVSPVPSGNATQLPDEPPQASKSQPIPLVLQVAILQVQKDSST